MVSWGTNTEGQSKQYSILSIYHAAIAMKEREGVPSVGACHDRQCHSAFVERHNTDNVCAPICLICARVQAYDEYETRNPMNDTSQPIIDFYPIVKHNKLFGKLEARDAEQLLGSQTYMCGPQNYGSLNNGKTADLKHWTVDAKLGEEVVNLLCCPEDIRSIATREAVCSAGTAGDTQH